MAAALANKSMLRAQAPARLARRPSRRPAVVTKAFGEPYVQVCASTAAMLAVGRLAFLPFQRRKVQASNNVGPKTEGTTYFDSLQKDASFITTTVDPAGFTLIDVFAWGALGHALGFAFLAAGSSNVIPGMTH